MTTKDEKLDIIGNKQEENDEEEDDYDEGEEINKQNDEEEDDYDEGEEINKQNDDDDEGDDEGVDDEGDDEGVDDEGDDEGDDDEGEGINKEIEEEENDVENFTLSDDENEDEIINDENEEEYDDVYDEDINEYTNELFGDNLRMGYINEYHPEMKEISYDEMKIRTKIKYDKDGNIKDEIHKTVPFLTKFEKTRVIGLRTSQIENNAPTFLKDTDLYIDPIHIAERELTEKKLPFIIARPLPNGMREFWNLKDLELIHL